MKICPVCEKEHKDNIHICECSFRFLPEDSDTPFCPSCKETVSKGAELCGVCGYTFPVIIHHTENIIAETNEEATKYAQTYYVPKLREKYLKNKIQQYEQQILTNASKSESQYKKKYEDLLSLMSESVHRNTDNYNNTNSKY